MVNMSSILGRMSTTSRARLLRYEEEKSSDEDIQQQPQVGIQIEWFTVIPESHGEYVREYIAKYGPIILCIYSKCIQNNLLDNNIHPNEVIPRFLSKVMQNCKKFVNSQNDRSSITEIINCIPNIKLLEEHIMLLAKGRIIEKV